MANSILFLSNGSICYDSTTYFIDCIGDALMHRGWKVRHIKLDKSTQDDKLRAFAREYKDNPFDIVFDINTKLDTIKYDEDRYCLEILGKSFWHYILDHPFYHHEALKCGLRNMNVICLDEKHKNYIESAYPHVIKCVVIPLAACRGEILSAGNDSMPLDNEAAGIQNTHPGTFNRKMRENDVIFTASYTDPDVVYMQAVNNHTAEEVDFFKKFTALLLENPDLTQEEAVMLLRPGIKPQEIAELLVQNFLADVYLQAAVREEIVIQLIKHHVPVKLYGHKWERFAVKAGVLMKEEKDYIENGGIVCMGQVSYEMLPDIYASSRICINHNPWFKAGMHDRVSLALMNGCVCVTDTSTYMKSRIPDECGVVYYQLEDIQGMANLVATLSKDLSRQEEIAALGYKYAKKHMTWSGFADEIVRAFEL